MQTLRKKTSPCKYKNDPSRFLGEGMTFKAKLIGILEVSEARGDKMCQDALNDLKTAIRAAGEHKQRITISIAIDGLKLRDEKTADCLYHHPVHKISFIAQDMSDSRAFGYIFGSPDTGHRFFGIKTDKTASQVVISMRDLFQVVFELKKKEIELAKCHSEYHQPKFGTGSYLETISFPMRDECEHEKAKGKSYSHLLKSRVLTIKQDSGPPEFKATTSEAIADLLDLELELNSIQQGINQMEKITPSDPFGPLSKNERFADPFDDSFSKLEKPSEEKSSEKTVKTQTSRLSEETPDHDKHSSSFFGAMPSSSKTHFFSQFSPSIGKSKTDDSKWFDQETESLFNDTVSANNAEPTSSPVALSTPAPEPDQAEEKKSPIKTDLFTELDPLGTGRVKPYIDKKDFFQDLKNPPKKVLKELIGDATTSEVFNTFFQTDFKEERNSSVAKSDSVSSYNAELGFKDGSSKSNKIDPFYEGDPFEQTDPFQEDNFSTSIGFPPVFSSKSSIDGLFEDKMSWPLEKSVTTELKDKNQKSCSTNISMFSPTPLRVTLPPEKSDGPHSFSTISLKQNKSNSDSPEELKNVRRQCYQSLKQITVEGSEESPVWEEPFVSTKVPMMSNLEKSYKENFSSVSLPFKSKDREKLMNDASPELPTKVKTTLFSIKPPPLPPKKQNMPYIKPPPRPPSLENNRPYYEFEDDIVGSCNNLGSKEELRCVKLKKQLFTGKDSPPICELKKQNSDTNFPVLPPPPQRKSSSSDGSRPGTGRKSKSPMETPGSILNLKLNQLDNTGLENLAITLGIPSENIYSMTLQELTKMLSEKYLTSTTNHENFTSESFEADFDSNFRKSDADTNPPPSYDKYAVFKELIESESKSSEPSPTIIETVKKVEDEKEEKTVTEADEQEDKYAALRQLSMSATKSENFSEEDDGKTKTNIVGFDEEKGSPAINNLDLVAGIPDAKSKWQAQSLENKTESAEGLHTISVTQPPKQISDLEELPTSLKEAQFSGDSQLFPLVDQFSDEKKPNSPRDNWATFEKSDYEGAVRKKLTDNFNDNENSPFSSDGKEEVREIPFHWHKNSFRKRTRKEVPWKDDDESWDEYSPKESYCSDESSHEERSPELGRENRYKKPWNVCGRPPKSERMWNDKSGQWNWRDKWQEETEDEFEDTWRKQRDRAGSYDTERNSSFWQNNYEGYNKRSEWCRSEPWDDNERRMYCYGNRRKRSESDNEYRKRCDSDASDKECVWTFQKGYSDNHGRSGKSKQYHGAPSHTFRDCPEYFHKPRSKHRKNTSQKRPSSASESKRNYEKMFSQSDYSCRGSDKTHPGKNDLDKEEYARYQYGARHRSDVEVPHYYSSYDRKMSSHHSKMGSRTNRGSSSTQSEKFLFPNKRGDGKNHESKYFDSFEGKNYKSSKSESRFTFDSEAEILEKTKKLIPEQSPRELSKSPDRRMLQWASTNGKPNNDGFYPSTNINDNFANFDDDFKNSPKNLKDNGKPEPSSVDVGKAQAKTKNLVMLSRQESTATLRKSDSINIFSRDKDPFEGDDFFSNES